MSGKLWDTLTINRREPGIFPIGCVFDPKYCVHESPPNRTALKPAGLAICEAAVANVAVVEGKAYELHPVAKQKCGNLGSSELIADKTILAFAKKNGIATAEALCVGGTEKYCSKSAQIEFGLQLMFKAVRPYPSRFTSEGCKELREECTALCAIENTPTKQDCMIECNQYESWNR